MATIYMAPFLIVLVATCQEQLEDDVYARVSKETTFATQPLDKNGNVDYGKLLRRELAKGIDAKENAIVDIVRILGPKRFFRPDETAGQIEQAQKLMDQLNMKRIPMKGDYFVSWLEFCRGLGLDKDEFDELYYQRSFNARFTPWTRNQAPRVWQWMELNKKWADPIRLASLKKQIYYPPWPLRPDFEVVQVCILSHDTSDLHRFCEIAATNQLATGQLGAALENAETIYRFGLLYKQGRNWYDNIDYVGNAKQYLFLLRRIAHEKVQKSFLRKLRDSVNRKSFQDTNQGNILGHRIELLDLIKSYATWGKKKFQKDYELEFECLTPNDRKFVLSQLDQVDWNIPLKRCNDWYDRLELVVHQGRESEKFKKLDKDLSHFIGEPWEKSSIVKLKSASRKERSVWMARILLEMHFPHSRMGFSETEVIYYDRTNTLICLRDMTLLAFSLEEYRIDHKKYPATLEELEPKYIEALPKDPFTGESFRYKIKDGLYHLYSVGRDKEDEQGVDGDDIVAFLKIDP